jgi:hypothetical protein
MKESPETPDDLNVMPGDTGQVGEISSQPAPETPTPGESVIESGDKGTVNLSEPSRELAARILAGVSFEKRLIGTRTNPGAGDIRENIYSFEEAVVFLKDNDEDIWASNDWVYSIDQRRLQKWLDEVLGDKELADAIEDKIRESANYTGYDRDLKEREQLKEIKELMEYRLKQCQELMAKETES